MGDLNLSCFNESLSLGVLASRFNLRLRGDPDLLVNRVASLSNAESGSVSFLIDHRGSPYKKRLEATRATAVLLAPADEHNCPVAALVDPNPYLAFARIAAVLHPQPALNAGVHPSAVIASTARIAPTACVGAFSIVESDVDIGDRVVIGPGCFIQQGTRIQEDALLVGKVTVYSKVCIGKRSIVHAGVVLGADEFGFAKDGNTGRWAKVPQLGGVRIGDDVEIGANTTIDRGTLDDTVIEDGVKLDNQIQVGHNSVIGAHSAVAGCVGIAGSTTIGKRCMIGSGVGIAGHLSIADDVVITGYSLITKSLKTSGSYSSGMPAVKSSTWRRMVGHMRRSA